MYYMPKPEYAGVLLGGENPMLIAVQFVSETVPQKSSRGRIIHSRASNLPCHIHMKFTSNSLQYIFIYYKLAAEDRDVTA